MKETTKVRQVLPRQAQPQSAPAAGTARREARVGAPDTSTPAVSVVLPVLNEERDIGRLLEQLLAQQEPPGGFEVIVVDAGSSDRTREIVQTQCDRWTHVRLVDNPHRLSSAGRNIGARAARGRHVLYLDGHCSIPRKDYLVRLVEIFESSGAACLSRPQPLQRLAEGRWGRAIADARHSFLGHDRGSDIYGTRAAYTDPRSAGAAYVRDVLVSLRGYDERFDACEDVEFNHRVARAGLRSYCHPDLAVDYRPRRTLGAFFWQMERYGRGRARLMARHPGAAPIPLLGMTFLGMGLIGTLLLFGWKPAAVAAGILVAIWSLVASAEALRLGGLSLASGRIVAAFVVIHSGLVLGFWRGLAEFRKFRRPRREDGFEMTTIA